MGLAVILTIGVGLAHTGHAVGDPIAAVGSIVVLIDMLVFGWLVFRGERVERNIRPSVSHVR